MVALYLGVGLGLDDRVRREFGDVRTLGDMGVLTVLTGSMVVATNWFFDQVTAQRGTVLWFDVRWLCCSTSDGDGLL